MGKELLPHHLEDLQRSDLSDQTIDAVGSYSGTPAEVKAILGFDTGPCLVIPLRLCERSESFLQGEARQSPYY
jgi:hypothetical protein